MFLGRNLLSPAVMSSAVVDAPLRRRFTIEFSRESSIRSCAWAVLLFGDTLPEIVCSRFGLQVSVFFPLVQVAAMLILAAFAGRLSRNKDLIGFILTVAAARLGWKVIAPFLDQASWAQAAAHILGPGGEFFLLRFNRLAGAVLIGLTLVGSGLTRRDLFLCRGNLGATAQPEPFLLFGKGISWTRLAAILLLGFGILLPAFLTWRMHPDFSGSLRALHFWPWALLTAGLNAANEEFQFRSAVLARLKNVAGSPREAILMSGVFFGLGHYFGQPSGIAGVLMAGFAGWIWAKSMVETRGFFWAFTIHFVQDLVIFGFLSLSWVSGAS